MQEFKGRGCGGGVAAGKIYYRKDLSSADGRALDINDEITRLRAAFLVAAAEAQRQLEAGDFEVPELEAYLKARLMLFKDEEYRNGLERGITRDGLCAEAAVAVMGEELALRMHAADDEYFRERSSDIRDAGACLISILEGGSSDLPKEPVIYAAGEPYASEILRLGKDKLLAVLGEKGSQFSHSAIIARTMGVPVVFGLPVDEKWSGKQAVVVGEDGRVYIEPDEEELDALLHAHKPGAADTEESAALLKLPAITKSGRRIKLCANISSTEELKEALCRGAEGVGLYRSEALFLGRNVAPDEEEQYAVYAEMAEFCGGRELVIRSADLGSDKSVSYLKLPREANPALGIRGIRLSLDYPEMFKTQLRAVLRAALHGNVSLMLPMVSDTSELIRTKKLIKEAKEELRRAGVPCAEHVRLGVMIETPAAALISDELAKDADFFSIGTNDLAQYTLAADRDTFRDTIQPAVLKLMRMSTEAAHSAGIPVGICGGLATDQGLLDFFLDISIDSLSMPAADIMAVKKAIREK